MLHTLIIFFCSRIMIEWRPKTWIFSVFSLSVFVVNKFLTFVLCCSLLKNVYPIPRNLNLNILIRVNRTRLTRIREWNHIFIENFLSGYKQKKFHNDGSRLVRYDCLTRYLCVMYLYVMCVIIFSALHAFKFTSVGWQKPFKWMTHYEFWSCTYTFPKNSTYVFKVQQLISFDSDSS